MPIGALSHKPLPKSALSFDELKLAMIWLLYGSTAAPEISWFQALSAGNTSMFSASANVVLQVVVTVVVPPVVPVFVVPPVVPVLVVVVLVVVAVVSFLETGTALSFL